MDLDWHEDKRSYPSDRPRFGGLLAYGVDLTEAYRQTAGMIVKVLGLSSPELFAWFAAFVEVILGVGLILGLATRYVALASLLWVLVATAIAHRYWTYPASAQVGQYINWLKNIAIMGGTLYVFVTGAGRFSLDAMLAKR
jgi:uncharacterized membrane protein YphA (DoxX/SURF4 family)